MASRLVILCLLGGLSACQMPADTNTARYLLAQGNTQQAREQLRELAEAGDAAAQVEYGKLLAAEQGADPAQAMVWYQRAWQQHDYRAGPASLRLFKRYQGSLAFGEARARELLAPLRPRESEEDLRLALDVVALYPGAATDQQWQEWLRLYRRSCVMDCYFETYAGRYAQHKDNVEQAEAMYARALHRDPRAVEYLQDMHWQNGTPERFVALMQDLEGDVSLDGAYCLRVATLIKANATAAEHDPSVMRWLQRAADNGEPQALSEQLRYMLSWPNFYSHRDFTAKVAELMPLDPAVATFFRAQGDMQSGWYALRPERARDDLEKLVSQGMTQALMPLGTLYQSGFLGEADMERAVMYYTRAAEAGMAEGDASLSSLYATGRGVMRDPIRAYAHKEASKVLLPRTARQESDERLELPEALQPAADQAAQKLVAQRRRWLEEQFHVAITP
ncbi:alginate biosynthesis regulator [Alcanivorax nanhaiticus]|uniref:Alginate biosynthesis regulator n=1 Tax=Alcanivorax nanhaiticus TaxID=1177154 RepID=A0A095UM97_9GAMM|nr:sel1 repeat family protein [Alcanivorax nanhaiticus]KGD63610.1 alginate biosynthesis regulator [Alcanivorax nanhaiticus]